MEKVVILLRKPPYGSVYTAEALRTMMGIGVFEMDICVVFIDDGVYAIVKNQNPAKLEMKPLVQGFEMLKEFNVNKFIVHGDSLAERGLNQADLGLDVEIADSARIAGILQAYEKVLPF
jgi:tRNA 2-thiouridine synthesizing protein C